jgi:hypothetical protein
MLHSGEDHHLFGRNFCGAAFPIWPAISSRSGLFPNGWLARKQLFRGRSYAAGGDPG